MAKDAIHLLFDVEGGEKLTEGSGAEILRQLSSIVDQINRGNHLPKIKIQFDADKAVEELRKQLEDLSSHGTGGMFDGIGAQLDRIAGNTEPLKNLENYVISLMRAIGATTSKLNEIFESMPDGMDDSISGIQKVTDGVRSLVDQIQELSTIVEDIKLKPSSVINNFVGGAGSEDMAKLELMKNQARELMDVFQELYATFDSNYGQGENSPIDEAFSARYKTLAAKQDAYNAMSDANRNLFNARNSVDSATEAKEVSKIINLYHRLNKEIYQLISSANQSKGAQLPLPDLSELRATGQALKDYQASLSNVSQGSDSSEGEQSILDTAKTINDTLHSIEDLLTSVRTKIESTFDLSTVDPKADALKEQLQELADLSSKVKNISKAGGSKKKGSGGSKKSTSGEKTDEEIQQKKEADRLRKRIKEYNKLRKELERAATKNSDISNENGYLDESKTNELYKDRIDLLNRIAGQLESINSLGAKSSYNKAKSGEKFSFVLLWMPIIVLENLPGQSLQFW